MDLTRLEDDDLRRAFGTPTWERGRAYAREGRVQTAHHEVAPSGILGFTGAVAGTRPLPYAVEGEMGLAGDRVWWDTLCTCPLGGDCKHVVALLLVIRDEHAAAGPGGDAWERRLGALLDELEDGALPRDGRPIALLVDLARQTTRRWPGETPGPARGHLRLRPLQRGASGRWVRSNIGWRDAPHLHRLGFDAAHAEVVSELDAAHRAASQQMYFGSDSHLSLGTFGPSLWRLMGRAVDVGVELVPGEGLAEVRLAAGPATLEVDVTSGREGARVLVGARLEGRWYSGVDLEVLGDSGHGVALWEEADHGRPDAWVLTLAALAQPAGPRLRRLLAAREELVVPGTGRADLVQDYLPRLSRHVAVASSDGSVTVPEAVPPRLALTVTWVAVDEVRIAWSWRYRRGEDDRIYALDETRGLRGVRRPQEERALLDGLRLDQTQTWRLRGSDRHDLLPLQTFTGTGAIAFAEDVLPGLEREGQVEIEEIGARPDYRELTGAPVVRFAARDPDPELGPLQRPDWLDLEVVVTVDGRAVGLATLVEAMTRGQERVIMPDGRHLRIDRPELARLAELVRAARELAAIPDHNGSVRVSRGDLGLWEELADLGIVDAQAAQWVQAARALAGLETLPEVEPTGVRATLRSYQLQGFRWLAHLWQCRLGGILADDMGLGKTLQTLALVVHARQEGAEPFLVVAPTSVVSTWAHEAAAFTPGLVVRTVTESHARRGVTIAALQAGADVVVTSYTLLRLEAADYASSAWGGLVLDEAQTVKNHEGKTHQAVRRLDVPFRLALTGTPMENRLMELWSLLSIVAPGLYPWPQRFAESVANPVEKEGDREVLARFRRRIRPFLLRRTKDLVAADLPAKQEQVLEVRLTPRHRRVYETHLQRERQEVLGLVGDFQRHRIAIFSSLTRLRQLSLDAGLVDAAYDGIGSAKLDVLVDHLQEVVAEGHRALVFSQFTTFLHRARSRLDAEGITSAYLDGRTRRRDEVVTGFRQGDAGVFLISLKAGGVGLTLTEADYVFVLDPWWNPAVEAQAVDRAHRIGQDRPVMVYRLVSEDTIEEKVMALKARKAALFEDVLGDGGGAAAPIGADDVRALFDA